MFAKPFRALWLTALLTLAPASLLEADTIVTQVTNNGDGAEVGGTLRNALTEGLDAGNDNRITFTDNLSFATIGVGSALPTIDLESEGTLEIDARFVLDPDTPLQVRLQRVLEENEDPDVFFDIASGAVTLNELEFVWETPADGDPEIIAFQVDAGASLTYTTERDLEIGEGLAGAGTFIKDGSGVLTLTGDNALWLGSNEVKAGTLRGAPTAIVGDVLIEESATLELRIEDSDETGSYTGVLSGDGKLSKSGEGTVVLINAANAHTGGTDVLEGTLQITHQDVPGDVSVQGNAALRFTQLTNGTFTGAISGDGRVEKSGSGTVTLDPAGNASNTFTGGLIIEGGRIIGDSASIPGDVRVDPGTELQFEQSTTGTHQGRISGEGGVIKSGAGTLTLAGANSFEGDLELAGGELVGSPTSIPGNVQVSSTAILDFSHADDQTFGGQISVATGQVFTLEKSGAGRLTLSSTDQTLGTSSSTIVRGGTLALQGASYENNGPVTVESAGTLLTNATLDELTSRGRVAIGGDKGSLVISGNATLEAGSVLAIQAGPGADGSTVGEASLLNVTGGAEIQTGAELEVEVGSGLYNTPFKEVDVVIAGGGLAGAGNFSLVTPDYLILDLSTCTVAAPGSCSATTANRITLRIEPSSENIVDAARTPNQLSTATGFSELRADPDPSANYDEVERSLSTLTLSEAPAFYDSIAGEPLTALSSARLANASHFSEMLSRRFYVHRFEEGRAPPRTGRPSTYKGLSFERGNTTHYRALDPETGPASEGPESEAGDGHGSEEEAGEQSAPTPEVEAGPPLFWPKRADRGLGVWLEPFVSFGGIDGKGLAAGINSNLYGFTGGLDHRFDDGSWMPGGRNTRLGLGAGYTHSQVGSRVGTMSGSADIYQLALYGAFDAERFYVGAAGRYAYSSIETNRRIAFGDIDRTARGSTQGHEYSAYVESGLHFGDPRRSFFHPFAAFQFAEIRQDAFTESGTGALDLELSATDVTSIVTNLGVRLSRIFTLGGQYAFEPELRLAWSHEFGDQSRPIEARFTGARTGGRFITNGAELDRDIFLLGVGYVMRISRVAMLSTHYDLRIGPAQDFHNLSIGLLWHW